MSRFPIICVIGASGAGKTTLVQNLKETYPTRFHLPVSMTTRRPRPGERNGVDYHFVSRRAFQKMITAGELMEWAEYNGHLYGPARSEFQIEATILHVVEDEGARALARKEGAHILAVLPPDEQALIARLQKRGDDIDSITERIVLDRRRRSKIKRLAHGTITNHSLVEAMQEASAWIKNLEPNG